MNPPLKIATFRALCVLRVEPSMLAPLITAGLLCLFAFPRLTAAAVPIPDHLIYGTLAIDGRPVTRADTGVTIEARRTSNGPILATYRMGSRAALGDFYYALRIPVAQATDASPGQAALGESVVVTVRSAAGIAHQVIHRVTEPGVALRLDFGASIDVNGDGVPEGWELANFGNAGGHLGRDSDGDGATDRSEYFAGTKPTNPQDVFRLALAQDGAALQVSFRALAATGAGFEARSRYYSLESSADPVAGPWVPLVNYSRIPGNNQLVNYSAPGGTNPPAFFRARVWLE
ncbi:MAG: hypothetical protein JNK85_07420 [Verrucomicrobiales bacterium]|nr:hypothetical protein [Verrucomicrobiales bacterium]